MIRFGTKIVIGSAYAESWHYLDWTGYNATATLYIGYDIWTVEIVDYPELIIAIHTDDCIKI